MNQFKVTLKIPHTHRDKFHKVGDTITVNQQEYDWLLARGVVNELTTKEDK